MWRVSASNGKAGEYPLFHPNTPFSPEVTVPCSWRPQFTLDRFRGQGHHICHTNGSSPHSRKAATASSTSTEMVHIRRLRFRFPTVIVPKRYGSEASGATERKGQVQPLTGDGKLRGEGCERR